MADVGAAHSAAAVPKPAPDCELKDDLNDPRYRQLPLRECEVAGLTSKFHECDQAAVTNRNWHRGIAMVAIVGGILAVVFAIAWLAAEVHQGRFVFTQETLLRGEACFVVLAGLAILLGYVLAFKTRWLAQRHRASLCAHLKFEFLMQPDRWQSSGAAEQYLRTELTNRLAPEYKRLVNDAVNGPLPHGGMHAAENLMLTRESRRQLIEYYLERRLRPQRQYLGGSIAHAKTTDRILGFLMHLLFVLSLVAVGLHLLAHHFSVPAAGPPWLADLFSVVAGRLPWLKDSCNLRTLATFAVFAAASLPVLSLLFRAWRSAFEYSRNRRRFHAADLALADKEDTLLHGLLAQHVGSEPGELPAAPVLRELWWCEHVLTAEHLEWLSLMHKAEWYV